MTTSMKAEPAPLSLTLERTFDAPRPTLFAMWTSPVHVLRWWGPTGFTATELEMDFREGGRYRAAMVSSDGKEYRMSGVYREIRSPERIVFTFAWDPEQDQQTIETLVTVSFADKGGRTGLTFHQSPFTSAAERDGHAGGWGECLDKLGGYVTHAGPGRKAVFEYPTKEPVILITREFDAPRALIWTAMTKPEHMARWWGPHGYAATVEALDVRPGGKWRIVHTAPGGSRYAFFGEYLEVVRPERIVQTFGFMEYPPSTETMTLTDLGGGRTRFHVHSRFVSMEARDGMVASGMEQGAQQTYDRLEALLPELAR